VTLFQKLQARGKHFSTGGGVKVKNQVLSCNMIRWFWPFTPWNCAGC